MDAIGNWFVSVYNDIINWFALQGHKFYKVLIVNDRWKSFLDGLKLTLLMSLLAVLVGVVIGIFVAVVKYSSARRSRHGFGSALLRFAEFICNLYINIIRGTPVFVQLLIINFSIFSSRNTPALLSGVVCFGINSGAYVAEIIRAGLESVDKGQMEAGKSLGLNGMQTMFSIILPQAIKNILPALGNEFITLIKETAIAGQIAVTEITKVAQNVGNRTYDILPALLVAAAIYLLIVLGLTKLLHVFERRLAKSDRR